MFSTPEKNMPVRIVQPLPIAHKTRSLEEQCQRHGTTLLLIAADAVSLTSCEFKQELMRRLGQEGRETERRVLQVRQRVNTH